MWWSCDSLHGTWRRAGLGEWRPRSVSGQPGWDWLQCGHGCRGRGSYCRTTAFWEWQNERMDEWEILKIGLKFRPVSGLIIADERIPTQIQITTVIACFTDHLTTKKSHMTITQYTRDERKTSPQGVRRTGKDLWMKLLMRIPSHQSASANLSWDTKWMSDRIIHRTIIKFYLSLVTWCLVLKSSDRTWIWNTDTCNACSICEYAQPCIWSWRILRPGWWALNGNRVVVETVCWSHSLDLCPHCREFDGSSEWNWKIVIDRGVI